MVAFIEQEANEKAKKQQRRQRKGKAEKSYLEQTKGVASLSSSQSLAWENVHVVFWGLYFFKRLSN